MKFVAIKSSGGEIFINPANVFLISPSKAGIIGTAVVISVTGLSFEVEVSPSEIREKLEGNDKSIFDDGYKS